MDKSRANAARKVAATKRVMKRRAAKASSGSENTPWSRREAIVALVSIVVTAFGVVTSAVSTVITYEQLRSMGRERMTPYKTVIYNAKIESYRRIVNLNNNTIELITSITAAFDRDPGFEKIASEKEAMHRIINGARVDLFADRVIWGDKISEQMEKVNNDIGQYFFCVQLTIYQEKIMCSKDILNKYQNYIINDFNKLDVMIKDNMAINELTEFD